jgi:hypothetical protein
LLRTLREFDDVAAATRLDLNSGPLKYEFFRKCIGGTVRDDWDLAREGKANTPAGFNAARTAFIQMYLEEDDLEDQKTYLVQVKKPFKMSVADCAHRAKFINALMKQFPGSGGDSPFSEHEMRNLIYNMMPARWKTNFVNSGQAVSSTTTRKLVRYMTLQQQLTETELAKRQEVNRGSSNHSRAQTARKGKRRQANDNNNGKDPKRQKGENKGYPAKDCPHHPGMHSWKECYANPGGPNYKAGYTPKPKTNSTERKKKEKTSEAHHIEPTDSDEKIKVKDNHWLEELGLESHDEE